MVKYFFSRWSILSQYGKGINISDKDYFYYSIEGKSYVSNLVESILDSTILNIYSVPVLKEDKVIAILWASIEIEQLCKNLDLWTDCEAICNMIKFSVKRLKSSTFKEIYNYDIIKKSNNTII